MPKPWERRPEESAAAFRAAQTYFNLGPSRSIDAVAALLTRQGKGKDQARKGKTACGSFTKWSATHKWRERAAAWDAHLDALQVAANENAARVKAAQRADAAIQRHEFDLEATWNLRHLVLLEIQSLLKTKANGKEIGLSHLSQLITNFNNTKTARDIYFGTVLPSPSQSTTNGSEANATSKAIAVTTEEQEAAFKAISEMRAKKTK